MILLCAILKVVNGKSFFDLRHQSTDGDWSRGSLQQGRHSRAIRHANVLDIRMACPIGMKHVGGRCRKIY